MRRLAVVSLLVALVVVVSAANQQFPEEISAEDIAAIQQTWSKLDELQLAADWDGMLNLYTDTAIELHNSGNFLTGKYDIRGGWYNMNRFEYLAVDREILDIAGFGDTASVWVKSTMTYKTQPDREPINPKRIYFVLMRKVDGAWKIAVWTFAWHQRQE